MNAPRLSAAFGWDDALGMKLLADEDVVALGIELGIGQHAAYGGVGMGLRDEGGQVGTIVPRSLSCGLRQDELPLDIDHRQPGQRLLGVVIHAAHKKRALRSLGKPWG